MTTDIYIPSKLDGLELEEVKLYNLINEYRAQNGLKSIPASKALTTVANRHVLDLAENIGSLTHSWSDAPYDANNPSTYPSMWRAPQRFNTGYLGNAYENAFGGSGGYIADASRAFNSWKNSPSHNAVILNQGVWANSTWNSLGVGIYKGYAVLWFGNEKDPTGIPTGLTLGTPLSEMKKESEVKKDPTKYPTKYMEIQGYDGNSPGGSRSWKLIGSIDAQSDRDLGTILVNPKIGRRATVGSMDEIENFGNNGLGGDGSSALLSVMPKVGNIQFANYQSKADLTDFMTTICMFAVFICKLAI